MSFMLSVENKPIVLSVIMLSAIMLSVVILNVVALMCRQIGGQVGGQAERQIDR
jgi:hypothetical protein